MATLDEVLRLFIKNTTMKKYTFFLTALTVISCFLNGQTQERIFKFIQSGTSANVNITATDSLGNLYIAGTFRNSFKYGRFTITGNTNSEANDSYLLKVLPNGSAAYLKSFVSGEAEKNARIIDIDVNNKGEVAVIVSAHDVGHVKIGERNIVLSVNEADQIIAKISKNGFLRWAKRIRVTGGVTSIDAVDVEIDTAGKVYVTGNFSGQTAYFGSKSIDGFNFGYSKFFLAKYDTDGIEEWASSCGSASDFVWDTTGSIKAYNLEVGSGNNIYISGDYDGTRRYDFGKTSFKNQGVANAFLACYFVTGDFNWVKEYKGDGTVRAGDIEIDLKNQVLSSVFFQSDTLRANGSIYSSIGNFDMLVSKYEQNGTFLWDNRLITDIPSVSPTSKDSKIFISDSLHPLIVSKYYQTGIQRFFILKLNEQTGNPIFLRVSENTSFLDYNDATIDRNGDVYITGKTYSAFVFNGYNVNSSTAYGTSFLIKTSNSGEHVYGYQKENTIDESVDFQFVEVDNFKNLMIAGNYFGSTIILDNTASMADKSGVFVVRYTPIAEIQGKVVNENANAITSGFVKLFGYAIYQRCPIADSVAIQSDGSYVFNKVPLGIYLIKALPDTSSGMNYLPAFYVSAGHWEDALRLRVEDKITYSDIDIIVQQKPDLNGGGRVKGTVFEVEEDDIFKSEMNKPRAKSKASLAKSKLKSGYEIIAVTETDTYGFFYFSGVEDGDYKVFIDEPGLPNISVHDITITGNSFVSSVDYLMNEENVEAVGEPQTSNLSSSGINDFITIYPNPSSGRIFISTINNSTVESFKILSLDGKIIMNENIALSNEYIELDLKPGVYFIEVNTKSQSVFKKLVINN